MHVKPARAYRTHSCLPTVLPSPLPSRPSDPYYPLLPPLPGGGGGREEEKEEWWRRREGG